MDETEFKQTYSDYNDRPCVFAKALLTRCTGCTRAQKLNIAEREAMACRSSAAQARCATVLDLLHKKALFALKLTHLEGPLPHGKEIKVQCGGLTGIGGVMGNDGITDVNDLLTRTEERYGTFDTLPYNEIVKAIVACQPRKRTSDRFTT